MNRAASIVGPVGSPSRIRRCAFIAAVMASLGITGGTLWQMEAVPDRGRLVLEFDTKPFTKGILQGQVVQAPLWVRNVGTGCVTIRDVQVSCGCKSVLDAAGSPLSVPQTVDPGGAVEWRVALSAESEAPLSIRPVQVEYACDGNVFTCDAELRLHVCAGPHSMTGPIVLAPGQLEGTATIGDAFPDGGVAFRGVEVKSSDIESASLEAVQESPVGGKEAGGEASPCRTVPRYRLHVRGRRADRDYTGCVALLPTDSERQSVQIAVHFRSERHQSDWEVFPSELVVSRNDAGAVTREICVLPATGATPDFKSFRVSTSSTDLRAVPRISRSALIISVTIGPDLEERVEESITVFDQDGRRICVVPVVRFSGL